MKTIICERIDNLINILNEQIGKSELYIYGCDTIAKKTYCFLQNNRRDISGFLCDEKFPCSNSILGKPIFNLNSKSHTNILVATEHKRFSETLKKLNKFNFNKIIAISPIINEKEICSWAVLGKSNISSFSYISSKLNLFVDETSDIIIEDDVLIKDDVEIIVTNNSKLTIGKNSVISRRGMISVRDGGIIYINNNVILKKNILLVASRNSDIYIGTGCAIGDHAIIGSSGFGKVNLGNNSSFGDHLLIVTNNGSKIIIGEDNMFSYYIKMSAGNHGIVDKLSNNEITNKESIITGNHVWCGMGATLLPGCDIGNDSVIGASSLVNRTILANSTCAGNPARVLRENISWYR